MAMAEFVQSGFVLVSGVGFLVCAFTIFCLARDWYRHPDLQAVDPIRPVLARRSEALTIRSARSTQSTPIASATR